MAQAWGTLHPPTPQPVSAAACPDIATLCARHGGRADAVIEVLLDLQHAKGCVSDADVAAVALALNLSRAEVHGVRSFYTDLTPEPVAHRRIRLCRAEACQSVGAERLRAALEVRLGTAIDQAGPDAEVALETVYCLGNCALGPGVMVGDRLVGRATVDRVLAALPAGEDGDP